jgi:hypothetical protein
MLNLAMFTVVSVLSSSVWAAPPSDTPANPPGRQYQRIHRDPTTAVLLSLGGAAASTALVLGGESAGNLGGGLMVLTGLATGIVTPSFGEWYADKYLTVGLGIRVAGAVALGKGIECTGNVGSGGCNYNAYLAAGLVAMAVGTVYDVVDAGNAADRFNEQHSPHTAVVPTVLATPSGPVMAVGIGGSF